MEKKTTSEVAECLKRGSKADPASLNTYGSIIKVIVVLNYNDALYKKEENGKKTKVEIPVFFNAPTFAKMFIHDALASGVKFSITKTDSIKEDVYVPANEIETILTKTVKLPKEEIENTMKGNNPFDMRSIKEVLEIL